MSGCFPEHCLPAARQLPPLKEAGSLPFPAVTVICTWKACVAVSSVDAVGVLLEQPVNALPQVSLGCSTKVDHPCPDLIYLLSCSISIGWVSACSLQSVATPHRCCDEGPLWGNFESVFRPKGRR